MAKKKSEPLPYGPLGFPNVRAWGMAPPINTTPADLDPVEAAAAPIAPDPIVRKKRRVAGAETDAFQAVLEDVGGDYDQAIRVFASELANSGIEPGRAMKAAQARAAQHNSLTRNPDIFYEEMGDPLPTALRERATEVPDGYGAYAAGMAEASGGKNRTERLADADATDARYDRMKESYDRATGLGAPDAIEEESGPYQGAGKAGYNRTFTPSEVLSQRAEAEAARDAALRPMIDSDTRDMRDRAKWREDNPEEAASAQANTRARADDYRKERLLYRMAEQSGKSIEELRQSPQFASVGQIPSRDGGGISTLTRTQGGMQMREMPTSLSSARDAAAEKRLVAQSEREKAYRSQMMLAGTNPAKNAVNAFNIMTPEQQQTVMESRLRYPNRDGGKSDEWDRRLDLMRMQMENDRGEREKDRTMTREERQAAREADERRFAEERARRDQEWKEKSAQFERELALRQGQSTQEAEAARQRHEQAMVGLQAQLAQIGNQGQALSAKTAMDQELAQRQMAASEKAERDKRVAAEVQRYGVPGVEELMAGQYDTPGAQEALEAIAAGADQSWTGFYNSDARRMDAELMRLGVMDPEMRRQLVTRYGLATTFGPSSRSGPISGIVNALSGPYR